MPEPTTRIAELRGDTSITALSNRLFQPATGRASLPIGAIRDALRDANPTLDLDNPGRIPDGTPIAVPPVVGAEPVAETTRPVSEPAEPLPDARPELGLAAEALDLRIETARVTAAGLRDLTLASGELGRIARNLDPDDARIAGSLLDRLRGHADAAKTEADAAATARTEAIQQLERDIEELVEFLGGA